MKRCCYQDCDSVKYPCGRITFFLLPNDERRNIWIQNSGNKSLLNIGEKAHRFFCENHFRECDIRSQFNRKTLRKHAVPIEHVSLDSNETSVYADADGSIEITVEEKNNQENTGFVESLVESTDDHYDEITVFDTTMTDNATVVGPADEINSVPYIIDFYDDPDEESSTANTLLENPEAEFIIKNEKQHDQESLEVYLEENSNNNQVDSSTLELEVEDESENIESVNDDARDCEIVVPAKKKRSMKMETLVETSKSEDTTLAAPNNYNSYEEDKHFALSLVGYFQRLPQSKKALAKLKILQYLTELEIDSPTSL